MPRKLVLIIAPPQATVQDVVGPWEVFCRAQHYAPGSHEVVIAATDRRLTVETKYGLPIVASRSAREVTGEIDTVLVAGSQQGVTGRADAAFLAWLRDAAGRTRRMGSVCTGAFYLAHAGLLKGKRATTHWRFLDRLAAEFPQVTVDPKPIFIQDGNIYTSAGITAGIDLALAMVEADCGHAVARDIARDLVVFVQRPADQPQLSRSLTQRLAERDPIRQLQQWAPDNLDALTTVEDMAAFARMSSRNFARIFKAQTGMTPGRYLRDLRVEAARRRARETNGHAAAADVGFGSDRSMRRALRRGMPESGAPPAKG
jgi:transcriptional regulator GlxA family with amidase domain